MATTATFDGIPALVALAPTLHDALAALVPAEHLLTSPIDRIAYASDASFYRLVPQAVVLASSIDQVRALFGISRSHRVPITFRAAGTSLSGQAITDGLLVEVARHWKEVTIEDEGRRVRVRPGVIGGRVNQQLKAYGTRLGPDPASIHSCTVGGILANNSSGMCCGVEQNAYHTLDSLTFVLPSGTVVDTAQPDADERFRALEPRLTEGLLAIRREIEAHTALRDRIRAKYRMKNTTGYSLNAFLDFERPVDIMRHLLVGSEGTLGFIAEAVLETVADLPVKYTGLLLFPDLRAAGAAIPAITQAGAAAAEIMDRAALRSVAHRRGVPPELSTLAAGAAGVLVEFQAREESDRRELERAALDVTTRQTLVCPPRFTHDPVGQARLWSVRQGMFPSVGAVRRSGTTVITEDVAFPVDRLADAILDLTHLFRTHDYDDAIVFGHAKEGNLHFVISQSFGDVHAVNRYARFMDDLVRLVVGRYDGALKAEHGTGRNMAPFVEAEWGADAVALMHRLKDLVDPDRLLNPGVVLNSSRQAHIEHLKPLPTVEPEVDKCIECGFCESTCPSRELTFTPRQRIVVRREIQRLAARADEEHGARALFASLEADFPYRALDTCAVDGLCATACPVEIDTGTLTKRFRALRHTDRATRAANWCADHLAMVEVSSRAALGLGHALSTLTGDARLESLTTWGARALGLPMPRWIAPMPRVAPAWIGIAPSPDALTGASPETAILYFPSCLTRVLGRLPGDPREPGLAATVVTLARRAGLSVAIPPEARGRCCGVPFSSKGYPEAHRRVVARLVEKLHAWSHDGRFPIVVDASPCAHGLLTCREALPQALQAQYDRLRILDSVAFAEMLLPRLRVTRRQRRVALHPVCSVTKMGLAPALAAVGRALAEEAIVPASAGCCGFAGDRGFLVPELTKAAMRVEAAEIASAQPDGGYSSSPTCEIGLARATGTPWRSLLYLLEEATRS